MKRQALLNAYKMIDRNIKGLDVRIVEYTGLQMVTVRKSVKYNFKSAKHTTLAKISYALKKISEIGQKSAPHLEWPEVNLYTIKRKEIKAKI